MGWVILALLVLVVVLLWRRYSRSSSVGQDHAQSVMTDQSAMRGPRQGGGPL